MGVEVAANELSQLGAFGPIRCDDHAALWPGDIFRSDRGKPGVLVVVLVNGGSLGNLRRLCPFDLLCEVQCGGFGYIGSKPLAQCLGIVGVDAGVLGRA